MSLGVKEAEKSEEEAAESILQGWVNERHCVSCSLLGWEVLGNQRGSLWHILRGCTPSL